MSPDGLVIVKRQGWGEPVATSHADEEMLHHPPSPRTPGRLASADALQAETLAGRGHPEVPSRCVSGVLVPRRAHRRLIRAAAGESRSRPWCTSRWMLSHRGHPIQKKPRHRTPGAFPGRPETGHGARAAHPRQTRRPVTTRSTRQTFVSRARRAAKTRGVIRHALAVIWPPATSPPATRSRARTQAQWPRAHMEKPPPVRPRRRSPCRERSGRKHPTQGGR
jgi:hypothetical protein